MMLSTLFQAELFDALFPKDGQPALAPWRLALVTIMPGSHLSMSKLLHGSKNKIE